MQTNLSKIKKFFKKRNQNSRKGDNGVVLVVAGSDNLVGAAGLSGSAALASMRTGIDLCFVATTEKAGIAINAYNPDLIVKKFNSTNLEKKHSKGILKLAKKSDSVLIGPGLGDGEKTKKMVNGLVEKIESKIILDADGINAMSGKKFKKKVLITPHSKELENFAREKIPKEKTDFLKTLSKEKNCTILLKGKEDIICDDKKIIKNLTGSSGMTVGGTGDILAGLCAGYCALGLDYFEAAQAAAFVNGKIGKELEKKMGYGYLASDFISEIPGWTKKLLK